MKLYPGRIDTGGAAPAFDLADSMAARIDEEFGLALKALKGADLPADGADDRKLLFLAIARGVLRYLAERPGAWQATAVPGPPPHGHAVTVDIDLNAPT